jgi:hypothetical protein
MQVRERALSDFADPSWCAARINNVGISHGFSPENLTMARVGASLIYWRLQSS